MISRKVFQVILLICVLLFCFNCGLVHPNIKITRDYVYNSSWGGDNDANMSIQRIILKEKSFENFESLTGFEILNASKEYDSTYFYITVPHDNHSIRKVFFNKKNTGMKWYVNRDVFNKTSTIGKLDLDTWYLFGGLYKTWTYYVYIDKNGNSHQWAVNPVNI